MLHPLEYEWTFWYDKRNTAVGGGRRKGEMQHYETNLREIGDFGTVEDFWRYFHHIVKPTVMESNSNVSSGCAIVLLWRAVLTRR